MKPKIISHAQKAVIQEYYLGGERSQESHFYNVKFRVTAYAEDGTQVSSDVYKLHLMCEPGDRSAGEADKYTCTKFSLQRHGEAEVTIPALEGWSYDFNRKSLSEANVDKQGQLFSIPNAKFEDLTDNTGTTLPPEVGYQVYSAFIYYHSYCTGLAEPVELGKGIQGLKRIGDRVVLESSGIESPIPGGMGEEGSTFKHGDETLEFKGLSVINDAPCAIVGFDSGEGSFTMIMKPMPNMEVKTVGRSHYRGDIYLDLESKWVNKVTKTLVDITKTTMDDKKIAAAVIETSLTIKTVREDEFS